MKILIHKEAIPRSLKRNRATKYLLELCFLPAYTTSWAYVQSAIAKYPNIYAPAASYNIKMNGVQSFTCMYVCVSVYMCVYIRISTYSVCVCVGDARVRFRGCYSRHCNATVVRGLNTRYMSVFNYLATSWHDGLLFLLLIFHMFEGGHSSVGRGSKWSRWNTPDVENGIG